MKLTVGEPYYVEWLDACFSWEPPDSSGAVCRSMGWLLYEDDAVIRLAFEVGENGIVDGTRFHLDIPKPVILDIKEI